MCGICKRKIVFVTSKRLLVLAATVNEDLSLLSS